MTTKKHGRASREPEHPEPSDKTVIRVRRGALRRYDLLKQKSLGLPVEIDWDRRTAERRGSASPARGERRSGERRQPPPFTWDAADFVVVGDRPRQDGGGTDRGAEPPADPTPARRRTRTGGSR